MGQVSLPVLSRKGKHDDWNYVWTSVRNYAINFNEDIFLKKFIFLFFMYGLSYSKTYYPIFLKKKQTAKKMPKLASQRLVVFSQPEYLDVFKKTRHNNFYVSKIFLCRYAKWVYIYLYIYSITNLRITSIILKKKLKSFNKHLFYQAYLKSKYAYNLKMMHEINNISKKFTSINQSHLSIEYANKTMRGFKNQLYGFGKTHILYFSQRFEKHERHLYTNFKKNYIFFNRKIYKMFPTPIAIHKKHTLNVYILDMIQSYKGVRHARGLPCRGQRTWTNAWTAYRSNTTLRVFKINLLKRAYKKTPHAQINTYYLAEQINLLWKVFWKDEWLNARKKVLVVSKKKNFSVDVASMAQGNIISPTRLKKMSKKQKSSIGKNTLTLGFEVGFTKRVLTDLYKRNKLKTLKTIKNKTRKKKIDIKTKIIKHNIKKKSKKSVWD